MRLEYLTVEKHGYAEIIEKRSKFIANVFPIQNEQEALEKLDELRSKYSDASHNVYAYVLGGENIISRFSDAGEPQGTAGLPILNIIKNQGLEDILIVVTRYFGGTLLGTGGLVKAYSQAAKEGINSGCIIKRHACKKISIQFKYQFLDIIQREIHKNGHKIMESNFEENINLMVAIPIENVEEFCKSILNAASGEVFIKILDNIYNF
jgi:uncharacterized YigZ family protein